MQRFEACLPRLQKSLSFLSSILRTFVLESIGWLRKPTSSSLAFQSLHILETKAALITRRERCDIMLLHACRHIYRTHENKCRYATRCVWDVVCHCITHAVADGSLVFSSGVKCICIIMSAVGSRTSVLDRSQEFFHAFWIEASGREPILRSDLFFQDDWICSNEPVKKQ